MPKYWICTLLSCLAMVASGQNISQTIRGKVCDAESKVLLPGVVVSVIGSNLGAVTDADGNFRVDSVPVARLSLRIAYIGYKEKIIPGIILTSAKEQVLSIDLEQSVAELSEVEVVGKNTQDQNNQMALISARGFNVEETERYAGSRGDPARMVSNFAGVQGSNDSRNDIVVRGNSPFGVIYRLEGIESPNPNHFAVAGTMGGPVSILNNKMLANSDFFTGAFSSEYGNSTAGVFDLKLRAGNNQKRETTAQFGFLGTELTTEGPLGKKGASYLVNYRYSTLKLFESLKVKIGTSAVPSYQDAAFKLNFPTKNGGLSIFGIGGVSNIAILVSDKKQQEEEIYGDKDRDQYFGSSLGLVGMSYYARHSDRTYSKLTLAGSISGAYAHHDKVYFNARYELDSLKRILGYRFSQGKQMISYSLNYKKSSKTSYRVGFLMDRFDVDLRDSVFNTVSTNFEIREKTRTNTLLLQPFVQVKHKFSDSFTASVGLHGQIFALNGAQVLEPRLALSRELNHRSSVSLAYGLHSQLQPMYIYFHQFSSSFAQMGQHNRNLGFTKSHHIVLGHRYQLNPGLQIKSEAYYQYLYNVPVEKLSSSVSLINQGTGFTRLFPSELVNKGIGRNYGLELTLERSFSRGYYFMLSGSLFKSEYQGSDHIWRSTDFDTRFAANLLIGREWKVGKKSVLGLGSKTTFAGGRRYGPADITASAIRGEVVYQDSLRNSLQFKDYFRTDLKLMYRSNRSKVTHEIGLDLVNLLGTKNLLTLTYAPNPQKPAENPIREEYQLGFLPLFYYKIDF